MKHQLITTNPITRVTQPVGGYLPQRTVAEGQQITAPDGYAYLPIIERPEYDHTTHRIERHTTLEADGWQLFELTPEEVAERQPPPDVLTTLNTAFEQAISSIPAELRPSFAAPYAIVRVLVQAGQYDLARSAIEGVVVPPELEQAKAHLMSLVPV